ncbi:MAG: nitrogenase component 1 [Prevotella sp.]|jgi:nitrogenase molybdenum-iron protein alpha/beta subunit|nr:nitrogenase component 1 [Prevotella sp.]
MQPFKRQKTAIIREKRLQAISAYYGTPDALLAEYADGQLLQRVRTFSQDTVSDILYALNTISTLKNVSVIVHGAAGCAVPRYTVTNLNERDSIMGGDAKLREAIRQVHKIENPQLVFVISTPVVAINNDDIESVAEELKDELGIPIVPVYTDGFRSKTGITGCDALIHAVIKHVLPLKQEEKQDFANLIALSEKDEDIQEIVRLLKQAGITANLFPRHSSVEHIRQLTKAAFSVAANPDEGNYAASVLEDSYDIPFIRTSIPVGIANTEAWITRIGCFTGQRQQAGELIRAEKENLNAWIEKHPSAKQKVALDMPPALAFGVADLLNELGHEVIGLKLSFMDISHIPQIEKIRERTPDFHLLIGDGQLFEEENRMKKLRCGLYIGNGGDYSAAIRNGIPAINLENVPVFGFKGVLNLAKKINRTLSNPSFVRSLAQTNAQPYTDAWLRKSPNWYIKQEVK